jgi:hypothetical protein
VTQPNPGDVIDQEAELLDEMQRLVSELPPADPYRAVIERYLPEVEEAVTRLQALGDGSER